MEVRLPEGIAGLPPHRSKLEAICESGMRDSHVLGMTIKGSFALDIADVYSDLDLTIVSDDVSYEKVVEERDELVDSGGRVVARFTGEHVGLPELLIVLYEDLVHADFKVLRLRDFPEGDEWAPSKVLWECDGALTGRLSNPPTKESLDLGWLESRMWTWAWYTQTKILRGELYEALDALQFVRSRVLFPLLAVARGVGPRASRRAEELVGDLASDFAQTVPTVERKAAMRALEKTVELYLKLADPLMEKSGVGKADTARRVVLEAVRRGLDWKPQVS